MDCSRGQPVAPSVVAKRFCDLLLQFPAAAIDGVQWRVLVRKYDERYSTHFTVASVGHSSALSAASTLLWDVMRLVDGSDTDNPVLAIENSVALTPRPGFMASWPSLYASLCSIVQSSGAVEVLSEADVAAGSSTGAVRSVLLSQIKPLLQSHWHQDFEETALGFLSEDGNFTKVKKMKHLVQALLRWRDQRVERQEAAGTKAEPVFHPRLEVVASKKHNDLVLRCPVVVPDSCDMADLSKTRSGDAKEPSQAQGAAGARPVVELDQELALLREENQQLRINNERLLREQHLVQQQSLTPSEASLPAMLHEPEIFDDPFEPPPQKQLWTSIASPAGSTICYSSCGGTPLSSRYASSFDIHSGATTGVCMTPMSSLSSFDMHSGSMTPTTPLPQGAMPVGTLGDKVCAVVPMWFSFMPSSFNFIGDRCNIPTGIVERFRSQFESAAGPDASPPMPQVQCTKW